MERMSLRCIPVRATLLSRGEDGFSDAMRSHVDACAACTSEVGDQRSLLAELGELDPEAHAAPAQIVAEVMNDVGPWMVPDPVARMSSAMKIAAAAAVATAATAAAAGTAIVFRVHRHRTV